MANLLGYQNVISVVITTGRIFVFKFARFTGFSGEICLFQNI